MDNRNNDAVWQYDTEAEKILAQRIADMEKSALDKFFNGDMSGYRELWSKKSFTYFDALTPKRVESLDGLNDFLNNLEGKLKASQWHFVSPRVQFGKDMAVLTFQLFAKTNFGDIEYNVVEVFQEEDAGDWHVIHSTWSTILPMKKYGADQEIKV